MKTILSLLVSIFCIQPIFACSCFTLPLCDYYEQIKEDETRLVFQGSFLYEEELNNGLKAIEFKVEEIYIGEIVTENSVHFGGETYVNTDSTVWILSGSSAACLRNITDETAIFAVVYNADWPENNSEVGYVPNICASDYFPISSNNDISGWFWDTEFTTLSLTEFENLLEQGCITASTNPNVKVFDDFNIYPNPARDILNIDSEFIGNGLKLELYDIQGKFIQAIEEGTADLSNLDAGIYFIKASYRDEGFTKKLIKL